MTTLIDCTKLPIVTAENARVGGLYKFCSGYMVVTSVYEATPEEIAEHELTYKNRCTWIDFNGITGGCGLKQSENYIKLMLPTQMSETSKPNHKPNKTGG